MKHYGDITKINGAEVTPVDIITGGSPCQDLSVAGKRAGLDGERSGLFMEQIRIIKEMREHDRATGRTDEQIRPRYMVWENVPGAFSSNGGEDFRIVLEETARIAEGGICIPGLEEGQRWPHAGTILGDGWSIAWRVHDAQYWGVPQRRKRITLVADFGGDTAPKILFERKGMPGDFEKSKEQGKGTAGAVGGSAEKASVYCIQGNCIDRADTAGCNGKGWRENQNYTLNTIDRPAVCAIENHPADSRCKISKDGIVQTLSSRMGTGGNNVPMVMSLNSKQQALATGEEIVRRLTPMECERLQGYPDGWTDIGDWIDSKGKKHKGESDAPRYKALGNSIALPYWQWMAERMVQHIDHRPTMASLFDGIGGFPLVYQRAGCEPVWASEIEEFPIAVTKKRFPENKML